jgi:hypothetical protein
MISFSLFLSLYTAKTLVVTVQVYCDRMTYATEMHILINNIKLQHPVALRRSDFAFFFALYVQHQLIFSHCFLFIVIYV